MRRDYERKWRGGIVGALHGAIEILALYCIIAPVMAAMNTPIPQSQTIYFPGRGTTNYGVGTAALSATTS